MAEMDATDKNSIAKSRAETASSEFAIGRSKPKASAVICRSIGKPVPAKAAAPKADPANPDDGAAPMPGIVASLAVAAGQAVKQGDLLLTIEAMKMETGISADRDGVIKAVHVSAGAQIDAKDLLVEFE